jgi:hypothetical protein
MIDNDTADQMAWVELAQAVRAQLLQQAKLIPAMRPEEINTFVDTCREALCLHADAETFDREVELKNSRITCHD